jgi:hypothetical protein
LLTVARHTCAEPAGRNIHSRPPRPALFAEFLEPAVRPLQRACQSLLAFLPIFIRRKRSKIKPVAPALATNAMGYWAK